MYNPNLFQFQVAELQKLSEYLLKTLYHMENLSSGKKVMSLNPRVAQTLLSSFPLPHPPKSPSPELGLHF